MTTRDERKRPCEKCHQTGLDWSKAAHKQAVCPVCEGDGWVDEAEKRDRSAREEKTG